MKTSSGTSMETGTGTIICVHKKADDRQKYRRYREELDGVADDRKGDEGHLIVTLEESTCLESVPELDAIAMGGSKAQSRYNSESAQIAGCDSKV